MKMDFYTKGMRVEHWSVVVINKNKVPTVPAQDDADQKMKWNKDF